MRTAWIPFATAAPPLRTPVLLTNGTAITVGERGEEHLQPYGTITTWTCPCVAGEWYWEIDIDSFTHWMPLPPLPTPPTYQ